MKTLTEKQRDKMYFKRGTYMIKFDDMAAILNSKKEHVVAAEMGKEIPDDVHYAIIQWIGGDNSE